MFEFNQYYINYYVYGVLLIVHCSFTTVSYLTCLLSCKMQLHFDLNINTQFHECTLFFSIIEDSLSLSCYVQLYSLHLVFMHPFHSCCIPYILLLCTHFIAVVQVYSLHLAFMHTFHGCCAGVFLTSCFYAHIS